MEEPQTGQRKDYGRVVDYIGLAKAIGESLVGPQAKNDEPDELHITDVSQLVAKFVGDLTKLDALFTNIDKTDFGFASLAEAHEQIKEGTRERDTFIEGFVSIQTVWEFLDPNPMLAPFKGAYHWLAKVYESIRPKDVSKAFLWERLGAKTQDLVHQHMTNVTVRANPRKDVTLDAAGLELVKKIAEKLKIPEIEAASGTKPGDVYQDVLDRIENRLKRHLENSDKAVYQSLAARIEQLRAKAITSVEESLAFLEQALQIAQDVITADRTAEEGQLNDLEPPADPKRSALTEIVEETTPPGLHKIVPDIVSSIDSIVLEVAYPGWTNSDTGDKKVRKELRAVLKNFGLPVTGELFNKIYQYARESY